MSEKEAWIGTFGPFLFDDHIVLDPDNETGSQFAGLPPKVINSDSPARIGVPVDPEDAAQSQSLNTIDNLGDVDISGISAGELIAYDGDKLVNMPELVWDSANSRLYTENRIVDRTNSVVTSTTTIANDSTEQTIYTGEIGADELRAGNFLKVLIAGVLSNDAANEDITIRIYLGSVLLDSFVPSLGNISNADWHVTVRLVVRSIGTSGVIASHTFTEIADFKHYSNADDISIDTTIAEDITVTVQWTNALSTNTISAYLGLLEYKH